MFRTFLLSHQFRVVFPPFKGKAIQFSLEQVFNSKDIAYSLKGPLVESGRERNATITSWLGWWHIDHCRSYIKSTACIDQGLEKLKLLHIFVEFSLIIILVIVINFLFLSRTTKKQIQISQQEWKLICVQTSRVCWFILISITINFITLNSSNFDYRKIPVIIPLPPLITPPSYIQTN